MVKSEASANATRNRGTLSENLGGGYNAPPPAKRDAPRIKPEAAQYANRNKGGPSICRIGQLLLIPKEMLVIVMPLIVYLVFEYYNYEGVFERI